MRYGNAHSTNDECLHLSGEAACRRESLQDAGERTTSMRRVPACSARGDHRLLCVLGMEELLHIDIAKGVAIFARGVVYVLLLVAGRPTLEACAAGGPASRLLGVPVPL
mmetsp:Transcript_43421/g.101639  ORF Transcript_43421/g.101639 Transcript_43421/m.101639 type:complete len:109 (-) Transcript_43421:296-622(-)